MLNIFKNNNIFVAGLPFYGAIKSIDVWHAAIYALINKLTAPEI